MTELSNLKINHDCSILVNSCDAYEDIWNLFFCALKDNWNDCDLEIYLNTETKIYKFDGLKLNELNHNKSLNTNWGARVLKSLQAIDKDFVICLYDDFVLEKEVNVEKIKKCIQWMKDDESIAVFYFNNIVGQNLDNRLYPEFELIGTKNDYRLNSAPAIWRRKRLMDFTGENDNPWAWEFFGSARTYDKKDNFYCAKINCEDTFVYNYVLGGAIRRGKWVQGVVVPLLAKYKINLDLSKRGIASESLEQGKYSLKWKIDFFILGFRMVGFKSFLFLYRVLKKKLATL